MFYFISDFGFFNENLYHLALRRNINTLVMNFKKDYNNNILLLGGDNFYPLGLNDEYDVKLDHFSQAFNKSIHSSKIYATLGNHDYLGDIAPQYKTKYFNMYKHFYKIENDENYVVFMIDTTLLDFSTFTSVVDVYRNVFPGKFALLYKEHTDNMKRTDYKPTHEWKKKQETMKREMMFFRRELLLQLDDELDFVRRSFPDKTIVVVGHYPIHTYGIYAKNTSNSTLMHLAPLLMKHGIELYISGHDHSNQHLAVHYEDLRHLLSIQEYKEHDDKEFVKTIMKSMDDKNDKFDKTLHVMICGTFMDIYKLPLNMTEKAHIDKIADGKNGIDERTHIKMMDMKKNSYITFERNNIKNTIVCFHSNANNECYYECII